MNDKAILLDAVLRPNPPMRKGALIAVVAAVGAIDLAFALYFLSRGAWPVTPFLGADVAFLAWAFHASRKAARRSEQVTLTPELLRVQRRPVRGGPSELALNPYWVRVQMDDPPEPWSQLTLWSHGKGHRIAAFLAPGDRLDFAKTLKSALLRAHDARPV